MTPEEGKAEIMRITEEVLRKIDQIDQAVFYKKAATDERGLSPVDHLHYGIEKLLKTFDFELAEQGVK